MKTLQNRSDTKKTTGKAVYTGNTYKRIQSIEFKDHNCYQEEVYQIKYADGSIKDAIKKAGGMREIPVFKGGKNTREVLDLLPY